MNAVAIRDERSAPFFDALGEGRLLLKRCVPHGHLSAAEVIFCAECGSADLEWHQAQGMGEVVSWTAIHSRPGEDGRTTITRVVGVVELTEGPWLLAPLLVENPATLSIGDHVALQPLRPEGEGEPIPAFAPRG
jgi:uncharacterized OB-fold protein